MHLESFTNMHSMVGDRLTRLPGLINLKGLDGQTPPFWKQCESLGNGGGENTIKHGTFCVGDAQTLWSQA